MGQSELTAFMEREVDPARPHDAGQMANGDVRIVWKVKGTSKKNRPKVIRECTKGQPVFIICDSNGDNCTVITEDGEELGRLTEKDSKTYHEYVEKYRYNIYIKRIRFELDKPRVKILLIVHEHQPRT